MHDVIHSYRRYFRGQKGFTLFEIVMVLLILGVISYFVATRLFSADSSINQIAEMELLKNHLRYAQSRALNTDTNWGIEIDLSDPAQSKYRLYYEGAGGGKTYVSLPADNTYQAANYKIALKQLIIASITNSSTPNEAKFYCGSADSAKPGSFGSPGVSGNADMTINTSAGAITIKKNTGYIP